MCEFVSWIETPDRVFFLTGDQVFRTQKGTKLQEYCHNTDDLPGHGAIRWFYGLDNATGTNKECTDFTSPDNSPPEIAAAIKRGEMRGMGMPPKLLTQAALAEYERVRQAAWSEYKRVTQPAQAEYERVRQAAWSEYKRVIQPALAEYDRVTQPAQAEYERVRQAAWSEYKRVIQPALAEYERVIQPALAEYERVIQPALAEYDRVRQAAFWDIFAVLENRAEAWR